MNQFWKEKPIKRNLFTLENICKSIYIFVASIHLQANYLGIFICVLAMIRKRQFQNEFLFNLIYLINLSFFPCTQNLMYALPIVLHFLVGINEYIKLREGELLKTCKIFVGVIDDSKNYMLYFRCQYELLLIPLNIVMIYVADESWTLFVMHILFCLTKYFASDMMKLVVKFMIKSINIKSVIRRILRISRIL